MKKDAFRIQQVRHRLTKIRNVVNWQRYVAFVTFLAKKKRSAVKRRSI